mgnify:CR=1 FL=1
MGKVKTLTPKMRKFVKGYIATEGNATKAALAAYNTKSRRNAKALGKKVLHHPLVQEELYKIFHAQGLDVETISSDLRKGIDKGIEAQPNFSSAMQTLQFLLKLYTGAPVTKHLQLSYSNKEASLADVDAKIDALQQLQEKTTAILEYLAKKKK